MSKSKGEFLTVSLLEERGFSPLVYRLFCLQSHYRKNLVFSWDNLANARISYDKLMARVRMLVEDGSAVDEAAYAEGRGRFTDALDNDLNTSLAVTALYDVFKMKTTVATKRALLRDFDYVLGIGLAEALDEARAEAVKEDVTPAIPEEKRAYIEEQIELRRAAKAAKNYAEADRIRATLLAEGITLIDTKEGTTYTVS